MKFDEVEPKLSSCTLSAISNTFKFTTLTPVQATTIPLFLNNKDVLVEATTGSGKTLAFGIPVLEILNRNSGATSYDKYDVGALILAPTRELATQIFEVLSHLCEYHDQLSCALFVGGNSVKDTISEYQQSGGQIIVGTPGRVLDVITRSKKTDGQECLLKLQKLEVMILDEADTLLDMGFKEPINQILSFLPKQRRTGLFSATQTKEVKELARAGLRNPVSVSVRVQHQSTEISKLSQSVPSTLDNSYVIVEHDARPQELINFILNHLDSKIIVFCATCACVDYYSLTFAKLAKAGIILPSSCIIEGFHGKMVQKKRSGIYRKFTSISAGVMFSTDVAARGVDIPDVDWIIQLAAPKDPAFFVHRVGRTARAGRKGAAILYLSQEEVPYVELLKGRGVPLKNLNSASNTENINEEENEKLANDNDSNSGVMDTTANNTDKSSADVSHPILDELKKLAQTDRDVLECGSTAFMSFLRAYKEHLCSYIFRFDHLDIGAVARSYGLLRLPKIPETRQKKSSKPINFEPTYIDTSAIPYHHKEKEAARQRRLKCLIAAQEEEQQKIEAGLMPSSASVLSRKSGRPWVPPEQFATMEEPKRKRGKKKGVHTKIMDEWDDLAAEEMAYKKFKRGKLSKEDYEACLTSESQLELDVSSGVQVVQRSHEDSDGGSDSSSDAVKKQTQKKSKVGFALDDDSDSQSCSSEKAPNGASQNNISSSSQSLKFIRRRSNAGGGSVREQQKRLFGKKNGGIHGSSRVNHSTTQKIDYRNRKRR